METPISNHVSVGPDQKTNIFLDKLETFQSSIIFTATSEYQYYCSEKTVRRIEIINADNHLR